MNEPWNIMLNELIHSLKDKYCMIPLKWGTQVKIHRNRSKMFIASGWREGKNKQLLIGTQL